MAAARAAARAAVQAARAADGGEDRVAMGLLGQ